MTTVFHTWVYGRFIEIKSNLRRQKLDRRNQSFNFLRCNFSNRDNLRAPFQFKREGQLQHLKRLFFLKNRLINFYINRTIFIRPSNETSWVFPALKSSSHCVPQSKVSHRSDSHRTSCRMPSLPVCFLKHPCKQCNSLLNIRSITLETC